MNHPNGNGHPEAGAHGHEYFAANADTVRIEDITDDPRKANLLRRIRINDPTLTELDVTNGDFHPVVTPGEGANEAGWLGHFVGRNTHLRKVRLGDIDGINPFQPYLPIFCRGLNQNRSIQEIDFSGLDLSGDDSIIFQSLTQFFRHNSNLSVLEMEETGLGDAGLVRFSHALRGNTSLKSFSYDPVEDEESIPNVAGVLDVLAGHPQLSDVSLANVSIEDQRICRAITSLLQNSNCRVHSLKLSAEVHNGDILMASGTMLRKLDLSCTQITPQGWRAIEALLKDPCSKLEVLNLDTLEGEARPNTEVLARLACALSRNHRLRVLNLEYSVRKEWPPATTWAPFSNLLCDTTAINKTCNSNHTLQYLTGEPFNKQDEQWLDLTSVLASSLALNRMGDPKKVAIAKILKHHGDINMSVFFEWELKVLPVVMEWLERADIVAAAGLPFTVNIPKRKLSAIYQFARGMPKLFIKHHILGELEEMRARQRRFQHTLSVMEERVL